MVGDRSWVKQRTDRTRQPTVALQVFKPERVGGRGMHGAPTTVDDTPQKHRHVDESREPRLVTESATSGAAPTAGSRAMTTNGSNAVRPRSGLHRRGKRSGRRRADSAALGRGRSLDKPRGAPTRGGPTTFARGRNKSGGRRPERARRGRRLGRHTVAPTRPVPDNGTARTTMMTGGRWREHAVTTDPAKGSLDPTSSVPATLGVRGRTGGQGAGHGATRRSESGRGLECGC
jgi:hypothetical protein